MFFLSLVLEVSSQQWSFKNDPKLFFLKIQFEKNESRELEKGYICSIAIHQKNIKRNQGEKSIWNFMDFFGGGTPSGQFITTSSRRLGIPPNGGEK